MAFSIFAFLPWCQLRQGHATVDIFTTVLSLAANRWIVALWEVLFAIALLLVAWRLWAGTIQMKGYGQTTFILQFPIWWAYAAALGAAVVAAITALYVAYARLAGAVTGRPLLSKSSGETH